MPNHLACVYAEIGAIPFLGIEIKDKDMSTMIKDVDAKKATIEQIKAKYESQLLSIEGVQGVGIGEELGKSVIKVYIAKKTKSLEEKIPKQIEMYPVIIEVTGEFHTLPA